MHLQTIPLRVRSLKKRMQIENDNLNNSLLICDLISCNNPGNKNAAKIKNT